MFTNGEMEVGYCQIFNIKTNKSVQIVQKLYLKRIHNNANNTSSIELLNGLSNKQKTCMTVHIIQQYKAYNHKTLQHLNVIAHTGIYHAYLTNK
jgi:hypothetical protein